MYKLLYSGQYDSLSACLEKMINEDSTHAEHYFLLGLTQTLQNNKSKALKNFEFSYHLDSTNTQNLSYYANALLSNGYSGKAEKIFKKAVQLDSSRTDIWDSLGRLYYRNSRYEEALNIYSMLSRLNSTNGYYFLMQARCTGKMDSLHHAIRLYNMAHEMDPDNIEIILELSRKYFSIDSLGKAKITIQKGIGLDNRNQQMHRLKADILYKQGDYTLATLSYLDAIAYGDNSVELLKKLGFCYFADQNYGKATEVFEQSLQLESDDPVIYYYLAMCAKQSKFDRQAINYFNAALLLIHPDYLGVLYTSLAECYHNEHEYINAIHSLRKAEETSSMKGIIYYELANVYYDYYKDKSVAQMYYKKAIQYELTPEIMDFINHRLKSLTEEIFLNQ